MKKVLVAGTWDIIHPGHIALLSKAKEIGQVIVVVARDSTVKRIKGREPIIPEDQRLMVVRSLKQVDEAVLGYECEDLIKIVLNIKPDIILLGPNQPISEYEIRKRLDQEGFRHVQIIRLHELYEKYKFCSTSAIIEEILRRYCRNHNKFKEG